MFTGKLPAAPNTADWSETFELRMNGDLVDLTGVTAITLVVSDQVTKSTKLTGSIANGKIDLSTPTAGTFTWTFIASEMAALCPQTYDVGCTMVNAGETLQVMIAELPVLDGIVGR